MANTIILLDTSIDVISKQRELVQEALGPDGVYIRMKETLESFFDEGAMKNPEVAQIVASTIGSMATSITAQTMGTALQWVSQEKDLYLKKEELEYRIDLLKIEADKGSQDAISSKVNKNLLQAKLLRDYGIATFDINGDIASLNDSGKVYEEIRALQQDTINKALLPAQVTAQTSEVHARTHKLVADTYVNHGMFTGYTISSTGIVNTTKTNTGYITLSDMNKQVAKEQAKGYAWNAWANVASSSAGMIGTLAAAEIPELVNDVQAALAQWNISIGKLNSVTEPVIVI